MKFGKTIRLEANLCWNTKWTDEYLDYKTFKQLINRLMDMKPVEIEKIRGMAFGPNKKRRLSLVQELLGLKSSSSSQSQNGMRSAEESRQDIPDDSSSMKTTSASTAKPVKPRVPIVQFKATSDFRKHAFQEFYRREFLKVDNFCVKETKAARTQLSNIMEGKKVNDLESSEIPPEVAIEKRKLLLRLSLRCARLEKFMQINFNGLEKVVKKFDKKYSQIFPEGEDYEPLSNQCVPLVTRRRGKLLGDLSELRSSIATCVLLYGTPTKSEEDEAEATDHDESLYDDDVPIFTELNLDSFPAESISHMRVVIHSDGLSSPITVPVIVAKGAFEGPILGITSALHGNELNGIPLIFRLIRELDIGVLQGTVVAVPVVNGPGFLRHSRYFHDGQDLNRLFPGNPKGNCGQQYVYQFLEKIVKKFDYNVDLHTASFGRINSLYVRADMNNRVTNNMAMLQEAQIIVHNTAPDGSMRSAAMKLGIPSITVEIGDPSRIHRSFVGSALLGVERLMRSLHMTPVETNDEIDEEPSQPVICTRSFWMFSRHGGLLTVRPDINTWVVEGSVIAQVRSIFGNIIATYRAPQDGIIVGKSVDPVCSTGDRLIHLGIVESSFPQSANDGHT